jgi:hypothetical protein
LVKKTRWGVACGNTHEPDVRDGQQLFGLLPGQPVAQPGSLLADVGNVGQAGGNGDFDERLEFRDLTALQPIFRDLSAA